MIVHRLAGCAPVPLAHYLKALGILRVVSEQADPEARGWWSGETFEFATKLQRRELLDFFLYHYSPMAPVSPWNKGSGFFGDSQVLAPIERSVANRFDKLRKGIVATRSVLDSISSADASVREIKSETKVHGLSRANREALRREPDYKRRLAEAEKNFKTLKAGLIPQLKLMWRGAHRDWLDAALVLDGDDEVRYPSLLGTGGNDGNLDFTNNYYQRLADIFDFEAADGAPTSRAAEWFEEAMFALPAMAISEGVAVGQFAPGGAGGANSTNGPDGDSRMNPADFVLMLEGVVTFAAAATRRLDTHRPARAAAPFVVAGRAGGYSSASDEDESPRGEQWMPLWSQASTFRDLKRLFAEGRAQLDRRGAIGSLDFSRAAARLGTARGIVAFQRFSYIERNGQSQLAVPTGRYFVAERSTAALVALDDLDEWLSRFQREAKSKGASARLKVSERALSNALFSVVQHAQEPSRWQEVLLRLADIEEIQLSGTGFRAGPIPRLRPQWIQTADDSTPEFRLAVTFALQNAGPRREDRALGGVRRHWLPLKGSRYAVSSQVGQARLLIDSDQVMNGRSGLEDAIALVSRRLIEAARSGQRRLPLAAARGAFASASDIAAFVAGEVDVDRVVHLARALMAVDVRAWGREGRPRSAPGGEVPHHAWIAIRLALLPWALPDGRTIGADPAILRRLTAGDASTAVELARRRLAAAGIPTTVRAASVPPLTAKRWAAALAFPISKRTATAFVRLLDPH